MLKALIFDVDGTLAETEEAHRAAFNDSFAAAGLDWHWDQALYAALLKVTGGKERMRFFIDAHGAKPELDDAAIAHLHREKTARYTALVAEGGLALRAGVERLIREAKAAGIKVAIATTTSRPNIDALLEAAFADEGPSLFDVIAAGDEVAAKKPAPDVYELALARLGLPPEATLALEDSENGLRSAMAAGIPTLITVSAYTKAEAFPGALVVLDGLGEPGSPAYVLEGAALDGDLVDLGQIRSWLAAS